MNVVPRSTGNTISGTRELTRRDLRRDLRDLPSKIVPDFLCATL